MDRGAWWASVHGVARVGHNLATKLTTNNLIKWDLSPNAKVVQHTEINQYNTPPQ